MNHRKKRVLGYIIIPFFCWLFGSALLYWALSPLYWLLEGKLNEAIINGASQYQVDGEFLSETYSNEALETLSENVVPKQGDCYARLIQEEISLNIPVYYGDSEALLQKGIGQYPNGILPGETGLILLAGHDTTFLRGIEKLEPGMVLTMKVKNQNYLYKITGIAVVNAKDTTAYDLSTKKEELILYTCYPIGNLDNTRNQRYFVYGERYVE